MTSNHSFEPVKNQIQSSDTVEQEEVLSVDTSTQKEESGEVVSETQEEETLVEEPTEQDKGEEEETVPPSEMPDTEESMVEEVVSETQEEESLMEEPTEQDKGEEEENAPSSEMPDTEEPMVEEVVSSIPEEESLMEEPTEQDKGEEEENAPPSEMPDTEESMVGEVVSETQEEESLMEEPTEQDKGEGEGTALPSEMPDTEEPMVEEVVSSIPEEEALVEEPTEQDRGEEEETAPPSEMPDTEELMVEEVVSETQEEESLMEEPTEQDKGEEEETAPPSEMPDTEESMVEEVVSETQEEESLMEEPTEQDKDGEEENAPLSEKSDTEEPMEGEVVSSIPEEESLVEEPAEQETIVEEDVVESQQNDEDQQEQDPSVVIHPVVELPIVNDIKRDDFETILEFQQRLDVLGWIKAGRGEFIREQFDPDKDYFPIRIVPDEALPGAEEILKEIDPKLQSKKAKKVFERGEILLLVHAKAVEKSWIPTDIILKSGVWEYDVRAEMNREEMRKKLLEAVDALEKERAKLEEDKKKLLEEKCAYDEAYSKLIQDYDLLENDQKSYEDSCSQLERDAEQLEEDKDKYEEDRKQLTQKEKQLAKDQKTYNVTQKDLEQNLKKLAKEKKSYEDSRSQLTRDSDQLGQEKKSYEESRSQLKRDTEQLEQEKKSYEESQSQLKRDTEQLEQDKKSYEGDRNQLTQNEEQLVKDWQSYNDLRESLKRNKENLTKERYSIEELKKQLTRDKEQLKKEKKAYEASRNQLKDNNNRLKKEKKSYEESRKRFLRESVQLAKEQKAHKDRQGEVDSANEKLAKKWKAYTESLRQLTKDNDQLESEKKVYDDSRKQLTKDNEQLAKDQKSYNDLRNQLSKDNEQLKKKRNAYEESQKQLLKECEQLDAKREKQTTDSKQFEKDKQLADIFHANLYQDPNLLKELSVDGITYRFRWCPPGSFLMGSPEDEEGRFDNEKIHEVTLTQGFWMLETPVTQEMWETVMKKSIKEQSKEAGILCLSGEGRTFPMYNVSWYECREFCDTLSELTNEKISLPTEAQWEYACRAGTSGAHSGTGNLEDMGWYFDNSEKCTHEVGQLEQNGWGLFDMYGNVWEWCQDLYGDYPNEAVINPTGPTNGSCRVARGGYWNVESKYCRSASRGYSNPSNRGKSLGFRLVMSSQDKIAWIERVFKQQSEESKKLRDSEQKLENIREQQEKETDHLIGIRDQLEVEKQNLDKIFERQADIKRELSNTDAQLSKKDATLKQILVQIDEETDRLSDIQSQQKEEEQDLKRIQVLVKTETDSLSIIRKQRNQEDSERLKKTKQVIKEAFEGRKLVPGTSITLPVNGIDLQLCWCPPGKFRMGTPINKDENNRELLHKVNLTQGFWMLKTPVTQDIWESVMGNNPSHFKGSAKLPVENVSWDDCQAFCKKLSDQIGQNIQLPTEAQWEYACRAGSSGSYSGTGNLSEMGWYKVNSSGKTHEVGQMRPNEWDLYDMHGNVYEWCQDFDGPYREKWYSLLGIRTGRNEENPLGPEKGTSHICRGGGYDSIDNNCRSAYRGQSNSKGNVFGFRFVLIPSNKKIEGVKEERTTQQDNNSHPKTYILPDFITKKDRYRAGDKKNLIVKGVTYNFRWCPPGKFLMGSPADEKGRLKNELPHEVTLTRGFWLLETPVTQEMWKSVMWYNPLIHFEGACLPVGFEGDCLPVGSVSWDACKTFCETVSKLTGEEIGLPSEAQWEYACRARMLGPYSGTGNLDEMGWYKDDSEGKSHKVGTKRPNAWGLYDMHGNVWEWCQDWYDYYLSRSVTDPTGPESGTCRVIRGGSWNSTPGYCRCACRSNFHPKERRVDLGFRLLLSSQR